MSESKIDSPHSLLIHFLGKVEKYRGIIIIAVQDEAPGDEGGVVVGNSSLHGHELLGMLSAALVMAQEDYRARYSENGEEQS